MKLRGKVAIVTGGSRGLGAELAEGLAARQVNLALAARSKDKVEHLAERLRLHGIRVIAVETDVTEKASLEGLVRRTTEELGPVDLLINNAGIEAVAHFHTMDVDEIEAIVRTNILGVQILSRLVLPQMIERRTGHIVNVSSTAGKSVPPFMAAYSASKHAVAAFSWSLRAELEQYGIGVTAVYPHYVSDTGMFTEWGKTPPGSLKGVSSAQVVNRTIDGIERNKAEVVVAPALVKIADIGTAVSVDATIALTKRTGAYDFHRNEADDRARRT